MRVHVDEQRYISDCLYGCFCDARGPKRILRGHTYSTCSYCGNKQLYKEPEGYMAVYVVADGSVVFRKGFSSALDAYSWLITKASVGIVDYGVAPIKGSMDFAR
jgi:hypothetical protein